MMTIQWPEFDAHARWTQLVHGDKLLAMFGQGTKGQDAVEAMLADIRGIPIDRILEEVYIPHQTSAPGLVKCAAPRPQPSWIPVASKVYRHVTVCHPSAPEYTKTEARLVDLYLRPHRHQNLIEPALVRAALRIHVPSFLLTFSVSIYGLAFGKENDECYVRLANKYGKLGAHDCLYVSYTALLAGNWEAVRRRNQSYLEWYERDNGAAWAAMQADPTCVRFKAFLDTVPE